MEQNYSPAKKPSLGKRTFKSILFFCVLIVVLVPLTWLALDFYLQSNKTKIFSQLEFLNGGTISFQEAKINVFKNFPSATLSINNLIIQDASFKDHQQDFLELGNLSAEVSLQKLLKSNIEIKSLRASNGNINIFTDRDNYSNLKALYKRESSKRKKEESSGIQFDTDDIEVELHNVAVHFSNAIKTSKIQGKIEDLSAKLSLINKRIKTEMELVMKVEELTLKEEKGSYLQNSRLVGQLNLEFLDSSINILPCELTINEESLSIEGKFYTKQDQASQLILENEQSRLVKVFPLLPQPIQEKLQPYKIPKPFYTKTTIQAFLNSDTRSMVSVEFRMEDNDFQAFDYVFKKVQTTGKFVNRIYEDVRALTEERKRFRLELENLSMAYKVFNLQTEEALFTSTPEEGLRLKTKLHANGKPSGISEWLDTDEFFFKGGQFNLSADINNPIKDYEKLVISSAAFLEMNNFMVYYQPADVAFPFEHLSLEKEAGDANFKIISSTFEQKPQYQLDGGLENFPAVVLDLIGQRSRSDVTFRANKLGWKDFTDLFGENGYLDQDNPKTDQQKRQSMKESLLGIQYDFQPSLSILIDTLEYYDLITLDDFSTGVHFQGEDTLVLEKTTFDYGEGKVSLNAKLDISQPQRTPFEFELHAEKINLQELLPSLNFFNIKLLSKLNRHPKNISIDVQHKGILDDVEGLLTNTSTGQITFKIDEGRTLLGKITYQSHIDSNNTEKIVHTHVDLEGNPWVFNEFFQTDQFFFQNGRFHAQLDYDGDVEDMGELLNTGQATFLLRDSEVYYQPGDVTFPLTKVDLEVDKNDAIFQFLLQSDTSSQEIHLSGTIQELSELLIGNTGKSVSTTVDVYSQKIRWQEIEGLFVSADTTMQMDSLNPKALKSTIKGIFSTFAPNAQLKVDTFVYSDRLFIKDLITGLYLRDSNTLVLDKTGFQFQNGAIGLDGTLDLSTIGKTPFQANLHTSKFDVAGLLKGLNYLSLPSLQKIDTLSGSINMDLELAGIINKNGDALIPEANKGRLKFEVYDIRLRGFEPLDEIAAKFKVQKRFDTLWFAPIANVFEIDGENIHIPLTEVRSNAINLFVEGRLSYGEDTNIWISLPIIDLLSNDPDILPEAQKYADTFLKLHVETTSDEEGKNQFKIRFSRKKFYKARGLLEQYKKEKKKNRQYRKEQRQKGD